MTITNFGQHIVASFGALIATALIIAAATGPVVA